MTRLKDHHPKIMVVGDVMIDHYLWGSCERISPEAPVQIVAIDKETTLLGGAGNVVRNLDALGASVGLLCVIGDDPNANELRDLLDRIGIDHQTLITQKGRTTSKKSRIIASNQQVLRYDNETTEAITQESQESLIEAFEAQITHYDMLILSDYNKGLLTPSLTQALITTANAHAVPTLVDPKGSDFGKYKGAYLLTPNKKEASLASKIPITDEASLLEAIRSLKNLCNLTTSLITLSEEGIALFDEHLRIHPTVAREVFDVTGAGDTVIASLAFALASDDAIDEAVKFANLCAGVVVGKVGSATASLDEIIAYEASLHRSTSDNHIKSWKEIRRISDQLHTEGKKIIFTNGCFDLLHVGHVKYLERAKSFGDVLIVGLNSDASVTRLKGDLRPINPQADRAYILASLEVVDYVVIFDQDTPYELIKIIQPDILVKGGDYHGKEVVGSDIAKEVRLVEFIEGKSTTQTIQRIEHATTC
jgi:D-beta-D-heptose 7-phosphate kinase/D-beta-D-heptose 1-phosphate adenosyltransferase